MSQDPGDSLTIHQLLASPSHFRTPSGRHQQTRHCMRDSHWGIVRVQPQVHGGAQRIKAFSDRLLVVSGNQDEVGQAHESELPSSASPCPNRNISPSH
jgi:hypothetical protein